MEYTVKQLAELSGVTPRTLRWYDREGLLHPGRFTESGYRLYGPEQVDRLQQILFYRELDLSLTDIRTLLDDPAFNREVALQSHLTRLEARRARLDALILTVKNTLDSPQGGKIMSDQDKFLCFKQNVIKENEEIYGKEVRKRYGDVKADRSNQLLENLTQEEYDRWRALEGEILTGLRDAVRQGDAPAGAVGARLTALHREWLAFTWGTVRPEAHRGLAALYTEDPRFTAYYDREVTGCAAFLRAAIETHAG